jgi:protein required for attachment to host cells
LKLSRYSICKGGWVVVADGEKAIILVNKGQKFEPKLAVYRAFEQVTDNGSDQPSDRPGRLSDGPSEHRSSVEQTGWQRLKKEKFAGKLSDFLNTQAKDNKFDEVIIVAPSIILHALRKNLNEVIASKLIGELDKDLTNHPVNQIENLVLE